MRSAIVMPPADLTSAGAAAEKDPLHKRFGVDVFERKTRTPNEGNVLSWGGPLDLPVTDPVEVSLILPTFNERECVDRLHSRIDEALAPYRHEVIVVDDSSPDGTADVVRAIAQTQPYRLMSRPYRSGLSSAVLDGCHVAEGTIVVVMDADGSHPPERLRDLIEPIRDRNAEFVLGSRRVPGGSEPGLPLIRWATSWIAALPARALTSVHDPMSGFFAVRRDVVERTALTPTGFKIALEILVKCRPDPVVEVPFHFADRLAGESKLGPNVIASYARHLVRLYRWRFLGGDASITR
jgi:dolichol-phosphate mannosyltransferase